MNIYEKLLEIQQTVKATKSEYNSFGKYSYRSAEGIIESIKPILAETKTFITLSDEVKEVGGRIYVKATATLCNVEDNAFIETTAYAREAETKKGMDESQITGAASSYARKYALSGLLLLDDNKDADTDEYQAKTRDSGNSEPEKATKPNSDNEPKPSDVCKECNKKIVDYQGQTAKSISAATFKKYGYSICMECSCKKRGIPYEPDVPFAL